MRRYRSSRRTRSRKRSDQAPPRAADGAAPRVLAHIERAVPTLNGDCRAIRGASTASTRCSRRSPIGWRTGEWRPRRSTTAASSTSTISRRSAWRIRTCSTRTHAFAFELLREGRIDGLRIDHVDGLYDPGDYLERLQTRAREVRPDPSPTIAALSRRRKDSRPRRMAAGWPVEGTTGYEFLSVVNGLFVDSATSAPSTTLSSASRALARRRSTSSPTAASSFLA